MSNEEKIQTVPKEQEKQQAPVEQPISLKEKFAQAKAQSNLLKTETPVVDQLLSLEHS